MKQYEAVIETLDKLGGIATLGELNREVFKIKDSCFVLEEIILMENKNSICKYSSYCATNQRYL